MSVHDCICMIYMCIHVFTRTYRHIHLVVCVLKIWSSSDTFNHVNMKYVDVRLYIYICYTPATYYSRLGVVNSKSARQVGCETRARSLIPRLCLRLRIVQRLASDSRICSSAVAALAPAHPQFREEMAGAMRENAYLYMCVFISTYIYVNIYIYKSSSDSQVYSSAVATPVHVHLESREEKAGTLRENAYIYEIE